jgi:hypothetical protein
MMETALSQARRGQLKQALAVFDRVLAESPYHPRRATMATFYYRRGLELMKAGKDASAARFFTKAVHLSPGGEFVKRARGSRSLVEARKAAQTPEARWMLIDALAHSPDLEEARSLLGELERGRERRGLLIGGIGCGGALFLAFGLLVVRRRLR